MVELIHATTEEIHKELARRDEETSQKQRETVSALERLDHARAEGKVDHAKSITMKTELATGTLRCRYHHAIVVVFKD
jgi:hypothetical protein